ncbi:electron transporter RnfD [Bifidobacterium goeldii]|uniref:Electron transporter RnfD n=1 Tax=Bifidobacterium goeldii TaxID=2306975 RepID=A0A430FEN8_9BIFI|nr:GDSL-type esterase/lipase family protein [Bifidobacterium goeldii]RSX51364.1 electron transporter RnfD [Bifidobacterium goeldii]
MTDITADARIRVAIPPNHPALRTMGRIDDADPMRPIWVYPYTQAAFRFTGTSLTATVINYWNYGDTQLGVIIDGVTTKVRIPSGFTGINDMPNDSTIVRNNLAAPAATASAPRTPIGKGWTTTLADPTDATPAAQMPVTPVTITLAEHLPDIEHEVVVYKRQDGQHYLQILGFGLDAGARVMPPLEAAPTRRIEVYGDSVSCGERNEASLYAGKPDPEADLSAYSDSWKSYCAITARHLGAALHDVSQGGASLIDGIGWFSGPDYIGQESIWDRIEYNPTLGTTTPWDFARYTPQVVIVAVGQNDAHPYDFMASDYDGEQAAHWRARYVDFLRTIHAQYPQATIICLTTVLQHDPAWDRAIGDAVRTFNDALSDQAAHGPLAYHFLFSRNGSATPGHPRVVEHEEMARELTAFIESLEPGVWEN